MKRKILIAILSLTVAIQFIPVSKSNPPVREEVQAPPEVISVLKRSCYDCHSNEVAWPWYARIAPVSFVISHHVEEGREHLNFSRWDKYDLEKRIDKLEESVEEMEEGEMPLPFYTFLHPDAKLSDSDILTIKQWVADRKYKSLRKSAEADESGEHEDEEKDDEDE